MNAIPSMMATGEVVADVNDVPTNDTSTVHTKAAESARARIKREHERNKLDKRLTREVGRAIGDFNMIEEGDKVMVCLSGGKDSYGMLDILLKLRERAPIHFDIIAVNLDQKQPGFPDHILPQYLTDLGVPFHIETQDTYSIVTRVIEEGKTMCSLCSRLRRGILYRVADELGATKIALGHHRDDIVATFFLNMFYGGTLKSMPAKLVSDDGRHTVIRPLAYVKEADLIEYADWKGFPIIPCNLCGSQENLKRKESSRLIATWEKQFPGRIDNIFNALSRVRPSHLMDRDLFDFVNLSPTGVPDADGDTAFDAIEPVSATAAVPSEADTAAVSACGSTNDTQAGKVQDGTSITEHAVHFLRPKSN